MTFQKYQHVESLNSREVEGLLDGKVYIFPKLDGANASIWKHDDGIIRFGSRNNDLGTKGSLQGFTEAMQSELPKLEAFFKKYPEARLFGEWLVPHTIKTYQADAWRKFYIFDMMKGERYLTFEEQEPLLRELVGEKIHLIPTLAILESPTHAQILALAENNSYLMDSGVGEGVVCKRYDFVSKYGLTKWGKLVLTRAKEDSEKLKQRREGAAEEIAIAEGWVKGEDIDKMVVQIEQEEMQPFRKGPMIPKMLGIYYHTFVCENIWDFIKKHPKVDFNILRKEVIERVKQVRGELFR